MALRASRPLRVSQLLRASRPSSRLMASVGFVAFLEDRGFCWVGGRWSVVGGRWSVVGGGGRGPGSARAPWSVSGVCAQRGGSEAGGFVVAGCAFVAALRRRAGDGPRHGRLGAGAARAGRAEADRLRPAGPVGGGPGRSAGRCRGGGARPAPRPGPRAGSVRAGGRVSARRVPTAGFVVRGRLSWSWRGDGPVRRFVAGSGRSGRDPAGHVGAIGDGSRSANEVWAGSRAPDVRSSDSGGAVRRRTAADRSR
jgi:hypothetical protein